MPFRIHPGEAVHTVAVCGEKGWKIVIWCSCGYRGGMTCAALVETFPAQITLGAITARLKCSACGQDEGEVHMRQDVAYTQAATAEAFEASGRMVGVG